MKTILVVTMLFFISTISAQYSNYYMVNENVKVSGTINENVNVSGTIKTIDYGKLALANAEIEKTRLQSLIYEDQKAKDISLEIASNPLNAYKYGSFERFELKGVEAKAWGFKKCQIEVRIPHEALFVSAGKGRYENVSSNGITTEINFYFPVYNVDKEMIDFEDTMKFNKYKAGEVNVLDSDTIFVHKKDINRATVFGIKGFSNTIIWEDGYENNISETFGSYDTNEGNGILIYMEVNYSGDKDDVTFEQLEGRKYYLNMLIEKIASTSQIVYLKY